MTRTGVLTRTVGAALVLALCAAVGRADQKTDDLFAQADTAIQGKDLLGAAKLLGDAAAHAHAKGLFEEEEETLKRLRTLVGSVTMVGAKETTTRPVTRNDLLVAVMERLDPTWAGAHVSAHSLATLILIDGATTGTPSLVGFAADALTRFAKSKGTGAGAKMLADWAHGLLAVENHVAGKGTLQEAVGPLQAALDACVKQRWQEPAIYVGTELATVWLEMEQPDGATAALTSVASILPADVDPGLLMVWRTVGATRLKDAPEAVLAPQVAALAPISKGSSAGSAGGAGGKGQRAGRTRPLEAAWPKMKKRKSFVTVQRGKKGFEFSLGFDKKFKKTVTAEKGMKVVTEQGVVVMLHAQAVCLAFVDPTERRGSPGESSRRDAWQAWYFLGRGEKWGVTRSGRVVVSK